MGRYKVEFSKKAAKNYKKLPENYKGLIDLALSRLAEGLVTDIKPVRGEKDVYRLRVGKYRVLLPLLETPFWLLKLGLEAMYTSRFSSMGLVAINHEL